MIREGRFLKTPSPQKFEYCAIRTNEGNGVVHMIALSPKIEEQWLKKTWNKIHNGSYMVSIDELWGSTKKVVRYLMRHYIVSHNFIRMSYSKHWVFKYFSVMMKSLIKYNGFKKGIYLWRVLLREGKDPNLNTGFVMIDTLRVM